MLLHTVLLQAKLSITRLVTPSSSNLSSNKQPALRERQGRLQLAQSVAQQRYRWLLAYF